MATCPRLGDTVGTALEDFLCFKSNELIHESPKDEEQVHSLLLFSLQPNCVPWYKIECIPICSLTHYFKSALQALFKQRTAVKDLASFPASLS